jgi:hypothetical protein
MCCSTPWRSFLITLLLFAMPCLAEVSVQRDPPVVKTRMFDPRKPPADMPPLKPGEAAVCESKFACQVQVEVEIIETPGEKPTCTVAGVKAQLRLDVVMWLPNNTTAKIRAHEDGHRQIAELFYARSEEVAKELAQNYQGKQLTITSSDSAHTQPVIKRVASEFCQEYLGRIEVPSESAQLRYDKLTDHGRNTLSEKEAIKRAVEPSK